MNTTLPRERGAAVVSALIIVAIVAALTTSLFQRQTASTRRIENEMARVQARMLLAGGNAVARAIATAIALSVVQPVLNGIGGDMFALVWHEGKLHGLNSSGCSPAAWTPDYFAGREAMPATGLGTVTVPGQVAGWKSLSDRFGKLPFAQLFEPAIAYAEHGFAVSPTIARQWATQMPKLAQEPGFAEAFLPQGRAPQAGEW